MDLWVKMGRNNLHNSVRQNFWEGRDLSNILFLYQTFCIKENHFMVLLFFMPEIMRQCRDFFEYVWKNISMLDFSAC